jgi:23S rRNA (adenine2030-N6)-methyltransferase
LLSYQHAFHAGNHADVLKHIALIAVLQRLNKKAKPYFALDTHAGAGMYDLNNMPNNADPTAFDKLLGDGLQTTVNSQALNAYIDLLTELQKSAIYPGSPMLLSLFARQQDNLHANELSPPVFAKLVAAARSFELSGVKVQAHQRDGFELLNALTPPTPNRGLILIDPPYEQAQEYQDLTIAVTAAIRKWPNGIYIIWYPLLSPERVNRKTQETEPNPKAKESAIMLDKLSEITTQKCSAGLLTIEFAHLAPNDLVGMYGSGLCIINPPYQLDDELQSLLKILQQQVQLDNNKRSAIKWRVKPD